MKTEKKDFESSLAALEEIVKRMEAGETTLDESIALFEQGIALSNDCAKRLETARRRILTLTDAETEAQNDA